MREQRRLCVLGVGIFLAVGLAAVVQAAPWAPWEKLLTLRRVEADPDKTYAVTGDNGPWMILACSFSGDHAEEQDRELVLELRKRYKLEAFVCREKFEFGAETQGRGIDRFGEPLRMRYQRGSEHEEVAVMVGNYPAIDDPEAQETLRKLKYFRPKCLELDPSRPTNRNLALWRLYSSFADRENEAKGPMRQAFITTNPKLPKEYFVPNGLDPLVIEANEGVEHCLLDCPGKYTVQVATFRGRAVLKPKEINAIAAGQKKWKSQLVEAAENAHKLTEALRLKGYEAYEFHDRYASIVTVGSFDWVTRELPDGRSEVNQAIQAIVEQFEAKQTDCIGGGGAQTFHTGGLAQQTLVGIPFDLKPTVVHVPRREITGRRSREFTGLF